MSIAGFLKKKYRDFIIDDITNAKRVPNVEKWQAFLDKFDAAQDYATLAYRKYLCRAYHFSRFKRFVLNFTSLLALFPFLPVLFRESKELEHPIENKAVLEVDSDVGYEDIFPDELTKTYPAIKYEPRETFRAGALCTPAKKLLISCVIKHPLSFEYHLWLVKELSKHSDYLIKHNPHATIVYVNERNVALPILKKMYEDDGRQLISFMHGDYLFQLIQGFAAFSKYYIWDSCYESLFARERWACNNYSVYRPKKFVPKQHDLPQKEPINFITYYYSGESEQTICALAKIAQKLETQNKRFAIRPHPRYPHLEQIRKYFRDDQIELPSSCSVEESLHNSSYAAGIVSTVLSEAYYHKKTVVIDDITDQPQYENLSMRDSILLKRKHTLLSDLLDNCGITYESLC